MKANALLDPGAVMIKFEDAGPAYLAVMCTLCAMKESEGSARERTGFLGLPGLGGRLPLASGRHFLHVRDLRSTLA